ncbi:hypothetical protein ACT7DL_18010 [Bacillus paranthracis]
MLGSLTGIDEKDVATRKSEGIAEHDYTKYLDVNGLNGTKIGVYNNAPKIIINLVSMMRICLRETIEVLRSKGATVVEDINIPSFHREWSWGVSLYELKHSLDNYLSKLPSTIPVHSISELMEFNENIAEEL